MKILVTGGAGYVGSHTVKYLLEEGYEVVVFDSLETGHKKAVDCELVIGNLLDKAALDKLFSRREFEAVFHFAAFVDVSVSMKYPERYFRNNFVGSLNLLEAMLEHGVGKIIFSSTSEVYGTAKYLPVNEAHPLQPDNPYAESKLMVEKVLEWYRKLRSLRFISLRYFNAAGSVPDGSIGEDHRPELHLIPNAVMGALGLKDFEFTCSQVDTPDGTTIRDYVHVSDIAKAHVLALPSLDDDAKLGFYNVGTGKGYSVKEVVAMVKKVTGKDFQTAQGEPRGGEPPAKYASNEKIKELLGWRREYGLEDIIRSAYEWHRKHPQGYID